MSITSCSILPKNRFKINLCPAMTRREITMVIRALTQRSCFAERQASSRLDAPMNWLVTTAPPVARAARMLMMRLLNMSTRETPDTAASPTEEIIMVSAMPTVMARVCSRIRGMISFFKSLLENIMVPVSFSPVFICSSPVCSRQPSPYAIARRQLSG